MPVLITGGLGVMGSWVARLLLEMGERPVLLDTRADDALVRDIRDKVYIVPGDVTDVVSMLHIVKDHNVDYIVHTAAIILAEQNPRLALQVNIGGTVNVLEIARLANIKRVVYTSSKGVYGRIEGEFAYPSYVPVNEDHPKNPDNLYEVSKLTSEQVCQEYRARYGVDCLTLRFAFYYGPGKSRHGALSMHSKLIENAMKGIPVHIPQGRDERNDTIYIADVAQGIVKALFAKDPKHSVFNIGTGKGITLEEMAAVLKAIYPGADITVGPGLDPLGTNRSHYCILDITRAREELGYEPMYDLETGIQSYIETCQRLGLA